MSKSIIKGFSKLSKKEKFKVLASQLGDDSLEEELKLYYHPDKQDIFDKFSENTLSNFYLPYGVAPNFLINGEIFHIPMVIEESSVVAAASAAAKFWADHGGFHAKVISTRKTGQVHFTFSENKDLLGSHWQEVKSFLLINARSITSTMEKRGGGIVDLFLEEGAKEIPDYFKINVFFETVDSMGANFINSVLENMAESLVNYCSQHFSEPGVCRVIMAILSNYTPDCLVRCWVEAPFSAFESVSDSVSTEDFVEKFGIAVKIAETDVYRAVTHNKGIMNGIDAVVLATGNDFRAVEAGVHAYASRSGKYRSLSQLSTHNGRFVFSLEVPVSIGVVGGLTSAHPLAARSIQLLGNVDAKQLMMIAASVGLANHFSAIKALITKGIQRGHMKMHLPNILSQMHSSEKEAAEAKLYFADRPVSFSEVRNFLDEFRKKK
jgi:hydroxymethylglutaryl-CoA reductase